MLKLKKSLGQNLLSDKNIRNKIINSSNITDKKILEIGPGEGFLTDGILEKKPKKLVLIEKDKIFYYNLIKKYNRLQNVEIYNDDALCYNFNRLIDYNIISNLPYNISTKLIIEFLKHNKNFNELILMIQKDVAKKLDYRKGKMNKYKFILNLFCKYKICFDVPPAAFYPKPKVYSSIIKINLNNKNYDWQKINNFVTKLFKSRRKIISNLINYDNYEKNPILKKRIEELKFSEILWLYKIF